MTDDQQRGNHGEDPAGGLDDDELRALFGADIRGDQQDEDISEDDQRFLRGLFAADVATPPPARMTVASILAAARNGDRPAAGRDPDTDRFRPVAGRPTPVDSSGASAPSGVAEQSGPPGFADRTHHGSPPAGASPVWPGDELGARRRRRNVRTGLLAAAAVAAVVAIGVPIALNSGNTSPTGADSAAVAAGSAAASRGGPAAQEARPQSGAGGNSDSGGDAGAAESSADQSTAAGSAAGSATDGDLPAGPAPSGQPPPTAASSAPSKGGASSQRPGSQPEGETTSAAAGSGTAAAGGSSQSGSAASSGSASDPGELSKSTCEWPELPTTVDQSASTVFGAGVVGGHRALTSSCLPSRVAGAVFPATNGSRGAVTVEVVGAATVGSCSADNCRRVGTGIYVGQDRDTTFVWLYQGEQQIKVGASAGLKLGQASLISFARAVGSIVR